MSASARLKKLIITVFAAVLLISAVPLCASAEENGDYKLVALTFDDGPGIYTERLLDELASHNAKATFFVVGTNAARYPDILRRIEDEGHQLANHTYNHPLLTSLSAERIKNSINSCRGYLVEAGGDKTYYLRPPYGGYNATVKNVAEAPLITWSVDPKDWECLNTNTVVKRVMNSVRDGDIILLHDIHRTSVDAAIILLDKLAAEGYELVTVSELLRRRGITPENGAVYSCARNTGVNLGPPVDPEAYDETMIAEHPAYDSIRYTRHVGIFSGNDGDAFYPNKYLTRGMFVTALGRFAGIAENYSAAAEHEYSDVSGTEYYAPYIVWAADNDIMSGYDNGAFGAEDRMTREQLAASLARYLKYRGISPGLSAEAHEFADSTSISAWAVEGVDLCARTGLLTGGDENMYNPQAYATRGQCAIIFERFSKLTDPSAYERNIAEMNGKPDEEEVPAPEPEAEPVIAPAPGTSEIVEDEDGTEHLVPTLSLSDGIVAAAGIAATAALMVGDRKLGSSGKTGSKK